MLRRTAGQLEVGKAAARLLPAALALLSLIGCAERAAPLPRQPVSFPAGFMWGAATAAHQVEGHLRNDWTEFERRPGAIAHGDTSEIGVDHYHRFAADFNLASGMGHNAHRLSLEWSRIEPTRGVIDQRAVAHYHAVFKELRRLGLEPVVTLHHFTNPLWVAQQGGWLDSRTANDFARFAAFAGKEYGAEVDWWITINEPNVYAFKSYDEGAWPPGHHFRAEALKVMANLAVGHAAAYVALHQADRVTAGKVGPPVRVGIAQHIALFDPARFWNPLDWLTAYYNDQAFNRSILKAVTTGELDFNVPGTQGVKSEYPDARNSLDFIGINYYTRWRSRYGGERGPTPGSSQNDLGWEIYPLGMYRALQLAQQYTVLPDGRHIPIVITENGIADQAGTTRPTFLVQHLQQVARAIQDGIPVRGYFHWSLMDNLEWTDGYGPRFGLYSVDRRPGKHLARIATPAVAVFKAIATKNGM